MSTPSAWATDRTRVPVNVNSWADAQARFEIAFWERRRAHPCLDALKTSRRLVEVRAPNSGSKKAFCRTDRRDGYKRSIRELRHFVREQVYVRTLSGERGHAWQRRPWRIFRLFHALLHMVRILLIYRRCADAKCMANMSSVLFTCRKVHV